MKPSDIILFIATDAGRFAARYSEKGLAGLDFPLAGQGLGRAANPTRLSARVRYWHRVTETALKNILAGREPERFPPLDPAGTEFQKKVWSAMRKIPLGKTKSYGELARAIGRPQAVRAVGGACGANPIPVLVPCHRVLAAKGKIGGFSSGLKHKRDLLSREGIVL